MTDVNTSNSDTISTLEALINKQKAIIDLAPKNDAPTAPAVPPTLEAALPSIEPPTVALANQSVLKPVVSAQAPVAAQIINLPEQPKGPTPTIINVVPAQPPINVMSVTKEEMARLNPAPTPNFTPAGHEKTKSPEQSLLTDLSEDLLMAVEAKMLVDQELERLSSKSEGNNLSKVDLDQTMGMAKIAEKLSRACMNASALIRERITILKKLDDAVKAEMAPSKDRKSEDLELLNRELTLIDELINESLEARTKIKQLLSKDESGASVPEGAAVN